MADKLDFVKRYADLYTPGQKPVVVTVPPMLFIMADGAGAPEGSAYQNAVGVLYALSYTIKMSKLGPADELPAGYVEYKVPPLEGLWSAAGAGGAGAADFSFLADRGSWRWTSMIRQPDFVTGEVFARALRKAAAKKPELDFSVARLEVYNEGLCVQALHKGPFSSEPETLAAMAAFMKEENLAHDGARRHHEIYLGDPRKSRPENMKTVLRTPVVQR